jgi:phosphomethylpyrimidine synthase
MTQMELARRGELSPEMRATAEAEGVSPEVIREGLAAGTIVLPANRNHAPLRPVAIGAGLRIKVNANLGSSSAEEAVEPVLEKLRAALEAGADTVMDLSSAGDLDAIRRAVIANSAAPVGTVPIYQAAVEAIRERGELGAMTEDGLFSVIEKQAEDGVDFMTVHAGVTLRTAELLRSANRVAGVVSRGGSFAICWMLANGKENPLWSDFDRLLDICRAHDVTLSLGDGLRPGCLADATDRPQVEETVLLGELVERAREAGVQAMVEGPGHVPLDQVAANVVLQKRLCAGAPFYVLGPLVTDIAPGYDHITSAIGGALAGMAGADFLCYVTPSEHLGLPEAEEVREGIMAARIDAHAADIVRLGKKAAAWDEEMAKARQALDWKRQFELAIDPERARRRHRAKAAAGSEACTMCGEHCVFSLLDRKGRPRAGVRG